MMRAAKAAGVERIVHCSSVAALGYAPQGELADEDTPTNEADFIGTYKRSKYLAERAVMDLVKSNAAHSFEQRFRVLKPTSRAIGEALQNALNLAEEPERIECFDISHIQGSDPVASMVVWEKGRMKKSDYRKFIIRGMEAGEFVGAEKEEEKTRQSAFAAYINRCAR